MLFFAIGVGSILIFPHLVCYVFLALIAPLLEGAHFLNYWLQAAVDWVHFAHGLIEFQVFYLLSLLSLLHLLLWLALTPQGHFQFFGVLWSLVERAAVIF